MKIILNFSKMLNQSDKEGRTNFFVWKNLSHLKSHYSDIIDVSEIDEIAEKIKSGKKRVNNKKFLQRKNMNQKTNEQCLCNLVEMEILKRDDAFVNFFKKPLLVDNCKLKKPKIF
jgi:hypothetical protein